MNVGARHLRRDRIPAPGLIGIKNRLVYVCRLARVARLVAVDDLLDAAGVASAVGLTHRNSVATYMRRYGDFPRPLVETGGGRCRLWSRAEVDRWIVGRRSARKMRSR